MRYLVRLSDRALRDMEAIYKFIEAESSETAFAWFNGLAEAIYGLERFPERGSAIPEDQKLRHLLFWGETKHLQNHLRGGQTQRCCERPSHPAQCEGRAVYREREGSLALELRGS